MSRYGEIRAYLGAEEHVFRLGLGQERAIQERCDAGLPELVRRLAPVIHLKHALAADGERASELMLGALASGAFGSFRVDDYREVILQGLIGGEGKGPTDAGAIVLAHVDEHPRIEMCLLALEIILAVLLGPEDEPPPGETKGAMATASPPSRAARSAGARSTAPAP